MESIFLTFLCRNCCHSCFSQFRCCGIVGNVTAAVIEFRMTAFWLNQSPLLPRKVLPVSCCRKGVDHFICQMERPINQYRFYTHDVVSLQICILSRSPIHPLPPIIFQFPNPNCGNGLMDSPRICPSTMHPKFFFLPTCFQIYNQYCPLITPPPPLPSTVELARPGVLSTFDKHKFIQRDVSTNSFNVTSIVALSIYYDPPPNHTHTHT